MAGPDGCQLAHNGEIYNYPELREELSGSWPFRSRSDTETILAAHDAWQDGAPLHFRGKWAYAHWKPAKRRLFASRDRFGTKPFYWTFFGRHHADWRARSSNRGLSLQSPDRPTPPRRCATMYLAGLQPLNLRKLLFHGPNTFGSSCQSEPAHPIQITASASIRLSRPNEPRMPSSPMTCADIWSH